MNARVRNTNRSNKQESNISPRKAYDSAFPPKETRIKPPKKDDKAGK